MPASDSTERRPAINEVSAKRITIDFDKKKVVTVTAVDSVVGVYVEPRADTTRRTNATNAAGKAPAKPATGTQPAPKTPPKTPAKPPPPSPVAPALDSSIKQP